MTHISNAANSSLTAIQGSPSLKNNPGMSKSSDKSIRGSGPTLGRLALVGGLLSAMTRSATAVEMTTLDAGGDHYPALVVKADSCVKEEDSCHYYTSSTSGTRTRHSCGCEANSEMRQPYASLLMNASGAKINNHEPNADKAALDFEGYSDLTEYCFELPANDTSSAADACMGTDESFGTQGLVAEDRFGLPVGIGKGLVTAQDDGRGSCKATACADSVISVTLIDDALDAAGIDKSKILDMKVGIIPAGESRVYYEGQLMEVDTFCDYINANFDNSTHLRPEGDNSTTGFTTDDDAFSYCNPPPGPDVGFIVGMVFTALAGCCVVGAAAVCGREKYLEHQNNRVVENQQPQREQAPAYLSA